MFQVFICTIRMSVLFCLFYFEVIFMTSVCIFFVPFWLNEMSAGLLGDGHVVVVKGLDVQTLVKTVISLSR